MSLVNCIQKANKVKRVFSSAEVQELTALAAENRKTMEGPEAERAAVQSLLDEALAEQAEVAALIREAAPAVAATKPAPDPAQAPAAAAAPVGEVAAVEPVAEKPAKQPTAKIDDFGQKLEGARKDYAATLKDAEDVDISAEPLSKSWPEPDYQKLLDGGADSFVVAFIHAARDEVPTKPQKSWKLKGWVDAVQTLRGAARGLLDGSISREQLESRLTLRAFDNVRRNVGSRAELYQLVGHDKSLKGITFAEHQYSIYKGQNNVRKWVVEQKAKATLFSNWPRELAVADTKEEMLEQFRARFAEPDATSKDAPAKGKFSLYTKRKQDGVFIGKKIGREYIDLKKLPDIPAARKFLDENTAELETLLEKYKETPFERNPENQPRVGDDHRNGAPVTPKIFEDTFGFRGVQFGNYVEQARRQSDLNQGFDSLMDLAAVLGVPPRALSLNGRLGLAFGARGKGGTNAPAAHYEPGNVVINLTKNAGPGSLAHEWWHAVDNYFGKNDGGAAYGTGGALTDKTRAAMRLAFNEVKSATQQGTLRRRAMELDKRKSKPYWDTPIELSARSFESYVIAKLKDQGAANDYLANVVSKEFWDAQEAMRAGFLAEGKPAETYPYPTPDEVPAVRQAFDNFFRVVETRTDDAGNVALFSRAPGVAKDVANAWRILSENDEVFTYAKSDSTDFAEIANGTGAIFAEPEPGRVGADVERAWRVYPIDENGNPEKGKPAYVIHYKNGTVQLTIKNFSEGSDGSAVYAAVGNYAFNSGIVFEPDGFGLTQAAIERRLENVISLALKFGSTDFIRLSPNQLKAFKMKWRDGDTAFNTEQMLMASYNALAAKFPEIKDYTYDLETGARKSDVGAVGRDEPGTEGIVARARATGARAGERTVARAIFTNTFASEPTGKARRELVRRLGDGGGETLGNNALAKSLYSRAPGRSVELEAADAVGREFWRKIDNGESFTDQEVLDALSINRRGSRRVARGMVAPADIAGVGIAPIEWQGDLASFGTYTSSASWDGDNFNVFFVPESLAQGADLSDYAQARDRALVHVSFRLADDGRYEISYNDPPAASTALLAAEKAGVAAKAGTAANEYRRIDLDAGDVQSREITQEAIRRLALNIGQTPAVFYPRRETGARAGQENTGRGWSKDYVREKFSRAPGSRTGVPMQDAKAIVAAIREAMPTAPAINVHDSVKKAPENLRRLIRQAGAENDVEAAYHEGEIHVFPGNIAGIERMQFVVAHHEIRHHGLRSMLGPAMGPAMLRMYASNPNLKAAADKKIADGLAGTRVLAVEEALADMPVEDMMKLTGWQRIAAAARQWLRQVAAKLRRAGLNTLADAMEPEGWTDNDIAALVQRAEDVSRGGAAPFRTGGTVFGREDNPDWYSALADQVGKASMNAGPASAWKSLLKNWTTTGKVKADEVEWSGLNEWLDMTPGKITKAQVADYLRANGVQVQETVLGASGKSFFWSSSGDKLEFQTAAEAEAERAKELEWAETVAFVREGEFRGARTISVRSEIDTDSLFAVAEQEDGTWEGEDSNGQTLEFDDYDDAISAAEEAAEEARDYWRDRISAVEPAGEDNTKYANYTLPGGTNYREVLLTLPMKAATVDTAGWTVKLKRAVSPVTRKPEYEVFNAAGESQGTSYSETTEEAAIRNVARTLAQRGTERANYKSGHWDQPNIVAHIRVNDRVGADGSRVLFVEELQSDYAQDARKQGIQKKPETVESLDDPRVRLERRLEDGKELTDVYLYGENIQTWKGNIPADYILSDLNEVIEKRAKKGVPAAPYIGATDKWVALAMKRVIKMAVDGGYDKVAFVTGEQSADRYDLSKQVSRVSWNPKTGELGTMGLDSLTMTDVATGVKAEQLADYIGKDAADKLIAADENDRGFKVIAGDDLKVGGSGMRAFYNKIVPSVAKDVLRKLGGGAMETVDIGGAVTGRVQDRQNPDYKPLEQPGFSITQQMRNKALGGMPLFSRADQTQTPAFRRWFGDSKVVDAQGKPLVVYHGTDRDFTKFDRRKAGSNTANSGMYGEAAGYFTSSQVVASGYAAGRDGRKGANVIPVYLSIKNPLRVQVGSKLDKAIQAVIGSHLERGVLMSKLGSRAVRVALQAMGYDGVIVSRSNTTAADGGAFAEVVAFHPEQIKSAIGNNGDFNPGSSDIRFSRAGTAKTTAQRQVTQAVRNTVADMLGSAGAKVSWWDKTLGTQYAKAQKFPAYKRVFDAVQQYLEDTSAMANEAADQAKGILPKLETWKDLKNFGLKPADAKAIAAPIFEGTLTDQKVYDDAELAGRFKLTPAQIAQYKEFRAAVNTSLDQAMAAEALRMLGDKNAALRELALTDREALRAGVLQYLYQQAVRAGEDLDAQGDERGEFTKLRDDIAEKYDRIDSLKAQGYAPLMRFGQYKLNITDRATGQTLFFGLYESKAAANAALRDMQGDPTFEGADFEQGVLSQEQYKLFSSMPLDSLEMFAEAIGADQSDVYQDFIRLAKSNRSAMKRLLKRKGTAGFSEDVPRVLAAFVTSNARMAAGALNMPTAKEAAQDIRDGDVQDEAIKLLDVVQNPTDTAGAVRSTMFVNFIGGSIASAVVNLTQPLTMTLPYLSQFGGGVKAAKRLMAAGKMAASGRVDDLALRVALKRAETDGIVSPQEIHHLTAQAMGTFGTHPYLQRAAFIWAAPFSLAEQFNRRVSFIAAFETAREQGIEDPFGFAEKAVTETQGLYNKGNAPNLARGTIGAAALTFKQFSIHYLEWMGRMYRSGPEGKKAVALALALLILAAGTDGLPFADDLDDLIDTLGQALGYDMNVKRARREFVAEQLGMGEQAADVMARGFSAVPGIPLDVSIRMSMGNLLPGTGMFLRSNTDKSRDLLEVAGPAGGLAKQYIEAGTKALKGDFGGAVQSALPVAFQNAFKGVDMWTTGEARDTLGRKVMDADEVDGLMKFIGFQPQAIARESEKIQMIRDSEQLAKNVEGEIASAWARAIVDKDPDGVADARAKLAQWNEDNPESPIRIKMQQIVTRAKKLREDRASRFITSVSPERRRAVAEALD